MIAIQGSDYAYNHINIDDDDQNHYVDDNKQQYQSWLRIVTSASNYPGRELGRIVVTKKWSIWTKLGLFTFPKVSWSQTSTINMSCNPSSTTKSKVWFQTGFKLSFTTCHPEKKHVHSVCLKVRGSLRIMVVRHPKLTLVLFLIPVFFMVSTTYGSAFPMKSTAGKSSADMTVIESTPLTITSFLFWVNSFSVSVVSVPFTPFLRTISKEVIEGLGANGLEKPFPMPNG